MKTLSTIIFLLFSLSYTVAQDTLQAVTNLEVAPVVAVSGNLNTGRQIPLRWAANSSVACFPATRFNEFEGNHLFYRITLPAYAQMKITVTPKNAKTRINLYALRLGVNSDVLPPDISRAVSCEASYPIWAGTPNLSAHSEAQSVEYISIRNPYSILIGVAGATGVLAGEFDLQVEITER